MHDIVCISHLRWDFVWQRPQHLLSRLAQQGRVLLVEEPVTSTTVSEAYLEIQPTEDTPNLKVVRLIQPAEQDYWIGHGDAQAQVNYNRLLQDYLRAEKFNAPVLWMYTPMGLDFVENINHSLLVYDVMDQLSAFQGAPPELLDREKQLLSRADLVFTGGVSLYRDKLPFNPETYLFPSGVEVEHFAKAKQRGAFELPQDLAGIDHPLLGYYGVIDERMDLDLLGLISQRHPEWQIVLLGPVAKINPEDLPKGPNLHYLGMKNYEQLPAYLAYFDVALVPFALNEATRYLSPTKTLEYLAAGKPVVSNPIHDVIELYGEVVGIGYTAEEFIAKVEAALNQPTQAQEAKVEELLARSTWDSIAGQMNDLIMQKLKARNNSLQVVS